MLTSGLYGKDLSTSFNSAIIAPAQKIKPKIIIKWLDSRHIDNLSITTNDAPASNAYPGRGFFFPAKEAMNGINRQSFTWAVAGAKDVNGDVIKADGTWYAMPSLTSTDLSNTQVGSNLEFGWWSNSVSRSNTHATYSGYGFVTEPYVQADFTTRKVNKIRIVTSEHNGQIDTYLLQAYDSSLNVVLSETGTIPDGSYFRDHIISPAASSQNISRIKVTINTTKNPTDYARIQEIVPIYEEDISDYVINYSVNRTRDVHSTSLPVGGSEIASVDLTFDNTTKVFNIFSNSSTYGQYMVKDLEVEVYTGWRIKKPQSDNLNAAYLDTQLASSLSNSATSFTVLDKSALPDGGVGNYFTVIIDKGTQSEEVILCQSVNSSNVVTVDTRGYGGTIAKSHAAGADVYFEIYEYVKNGTFYVDEWTVNTDMTVSANLQDWSKFLLERTVSYGFFLQNAYVGDAVKNLLMRANFPSADVRKLNNYKQGAKERGAIASYSFNESTVDRSGNNVVSSTGLRARFWGMPENKRDTSVRDIVADAIDKELSPLDKALGEKQFVSPSYVTLSKDISVAATSALDLAAYTFVGNDQATYSDFYNGVFDGYYIPTDSGLQQLVVFISYGGVRVYLDDILVLNSWRMADLSERFATDMLNLTAGVPRKLRIEFFHSYNDSGAPSFYISLFKALDGGSDVLVSASECCTIASLDSIGTKNGSSNPATADAFNYRNTGVYINFPKLGQSYGLAETSDASDKSILLESNAYVRIPYHQSIDVYNRDSWTIELYAKFHNGSFSNDGEYLSNWNNSTSTSGFEFFNASASNGFKFKTSTGTATVSSNAALSSSVFTHIAITYKDNVVKYYINGSLANSVTTTGTMLTYSGKAITIGGRGASYTAGAEVAPSTIRSFYIDEFAIYNKALTTSEIADRYTEAVMQPLTQFAFLYGNDTSIREILNDITFADMGRVFVDENDIAKYEHFYRFFEPSIPQHANIQSSFSDSTNIVSANYVVALQCNKVTVPVASVQISSESLQTLWSPPSNSSLATTQLTSNLSVDANVAYIQNIEWDFPNTGYIKIDSEIIKYISKTKVSFNGLERGQFQTTAATHTANTKVRESKYYDIKYDKAPAFSVRTPYIDAILFEYPSKAEITRFLPYAYGAELIVTSSDTTESGELVWLQGTDALTKKPYATSIAGVAVSMADQNIQVKEQAASLSESIRKYGIKDLTIQSNFITDSVHAKKLADFIISKTQIPVPVVNIDVTAMPKIQLGDRIRITSLSALDIVNTDYWVISHNLSIGDNVTQNLVLRKVS
jgi:hypothetical protein